MGVLKQNIQHMWGVKNLTTVLQYRDKTMDFKLIYILHDYKQNYQIILKLFPENSVQYKFETNQSKFNISTQSFEPTNKTMWL